MPCNFGTSHNISFAASFGILFVAPAAQCGSRAVWSELRGQCLRGTPGLFLLHRGASWPWGSHLAAWLSYKIDMRLFNVLERRKLEPAGTFQSFQHNQVLLNCIQRRKAEATENSGLLKINWWQQGPGQAAFSQVCVLITPPLRYIFKAHALKKICSAMGAWKPVC